MKNGFIISVYCGPQPPIEINGIKYPDRITEDQFLLLKDLGVTMVYGQCDIMNTETEEYAFRSLDICEKLGLDYLVKDLISREYCSLGEPMFGKYLFKDYRKLSEDERRELDIRFENSLNRYKNKKAFKGIIFVDEPGAEMFAGIARAKRVFDRVCKGKIFLVNHQHHCCDPAFYQFGGWQIKKDENISDEYKFVQDRTRFKYDGFFKDNALSRYENFIEKYFDTVKSEIFSYDIYPFIEYRGLYATNKALYELPQLAKKICDKYGLTYWNFLQCGGKWDGLAKVTNFAEVQLSVSVAMATGAKGLEIYTGCFPNDCLPKTKEESGVIDEFGRTTEQYDYYRAALCQAKAAEKYIDPAELKGIVVNGEYYDGNPSVEVLRDEYEMNDIYKGKLPVFSDYELKEYEELKEVISETQVIVSCFVRNGKSVFMVVNTSTVIATRVKLVFDGETEYIRVQNGRAAKGRGASVEEISLPAGENFVIAIE